MKYVYKNLKHVKLHGIEPGEEKEFDHEILGGGIELVEQTNAKDKKIPILAKIDTKTKKKESE